MLNLHSKFRFTVSRSRELLTPPVGFGFQWLLAVATLSVILPAEAASLEEVYKQAVRHDTQLNQAKASLDSSLAQKNSVRGNLLPQVSLNVGQQQVTSDIPNRESHTQSTRINISQSIFQPQIWFSLSQAEQRRVQAQLRYEHAQKRLVLRVVQAYFEVLKSEETLRLLKAEDSTLSRQLEQSKQRYEVGLSAQTDVFEAQAQSDSLKARIVQGENSRLNAYENLKLLSGQQYDRLLPIDPASFSLSIFPKLPDNLIEVAQAQNLDFLLAQINVKIAKAQIRQADSAHYPTLNATAQFGQTKNLQENAAIDSFDESTVGLTLSIPLFSGGKDYYQSQQARADYVNTQEQLTYAQRYLAMTVTQQANQLKALSSTLSAYQQANNSAKLALKSTEAGFKVGTRNIVDLLSANQRVFATDLNLSHARYDYLLQHLTLRLTVGELSDYDLIRIQQVLVKS